MIGRRDDPNRERTPEERARAAAERAARRAGKPLPPPVEPEPPRAEPPRPEPPRPEPPAEAAAPPPEPEPEPAPLPTRAPAPLPPRRTVPLPSSRRPAPPPRRSSYDTATSGFGRRRLLAVAALLAIAVALWAINATFQPFHGEAEGSVSVQIPSGADVGQIGEILQERGIIDSATFFGVNATVTFRRGKLRSGDYTLPQGMSNGQAIDALVQGPKVKVVPTFDITIPEGRAIRENAPNINEAESIEGDYLKATQDRRAVARARKLGLPRGSDNIEGFLFPATYELVRPSPAEDLVDKQLDAFADNLKEIDLGYARRKNLSRYDVLIIASMVEREAQLDRERPLVAAVIYNRLAAGMPLGIDATIRYVENNWTEPLKVSELERDTPYNTRLNRELPPTPIGNPGRKSLEAAANPAREDYLFYVVKPGTCGEHAFSTTDAEFARDSARYNEAREAAGGRSPTTC